MKMNATNAKYKTIFMTDENTETSVDFHKSWEGVVSFAKGICIGRGISLNITLDLTFKDFFARIEFADGSFLLIFV